MHSIIVNDGNVPNWMFSARGSTRRRDSFEKEKKRKEKNRTHQGSGQVLLCEQTAAYYVRELMPLMIAIVYSKLRVLYKAHAVYRSLRTIASRSPSRTCRTNDV